MPAFNNILTTKERPCTNTHTDPNINTRMASKQPHPKHYHTHSEHNIQNLLPHTLLKNETLLLMIYISRYKKK